jgi:hypothetical protein
VAAPNTDLVANGAPTEKENSRRAPTDLLRKEGNADIVLNSLQKANLEVQFWANTLDTDGPTWYTDTDSPRWVIT